MTDKVIDGGLQLLRTKLGESNINVIPASQLAIILANDGTNVPDGKFVTIMPRYCIVYVY